MPDFVCDYVNRLPGFRLVQEFENPEPAREQEVARPTGEISEKAEDRARFAADGRLRCRYGRCPRRRPSTGNSQLLDIDTAIIDRLTVSPACTTVRHDCTSRPNSYRNMRQRPGLRIQEDKEENGRDMGA